MNRIIKQNKTIFFSSKMTEENNKKQTIKIRCFADFTTSANIQDEYETKCLYQRIFESGAPEARPNSNSINFISPIFTNHYGINKDYIFTSGEDYTHVFLFNKAMPDLKHIPRDNVIGFAHEPLPFLQITREFVSYVQKYVKCYYVGDKVNLPNPFQEGNGYLSCYIPSIPIHNNRKTDPLGSKFMSIMISQKTSAPGHIYRHALVREILKTNLPIDIYGRGCTYYSASKDTRIKGKFQDIELYDGYQFTICIENFRSNHYFSEKIINPLNRKVTPVYLGCYNIDHYFPEMCIKLTGNIQEDMNLLVDIFQHSTKYFRENSLDKIDQSINLIRNLPTFF